MVLRPQCIINLVLRSKPRRHGSLGGNNYFKNTLKSPSKRHQQNCKYAYRSAIGCNYHMLQQSGIGACAATIQIWPNKYFPKRKPANYDTKPYMLQRTRTVLNALGLSNCRWAMSKSNATTMAARIPRQPPPF